MVIKSYQAGVTLIEMVVVVAIFGLVASILFFKYSDFNNTISIRNLSQEVALATRKAQLYATGVRSLDGVSATSDIYNAYGISFSAGTDGSAYSANNKQFILFVDAIDNTGDIDHYYSNGGECGNPGVGNECVEQFTISSADTVVQVCTGGISSSENCSTNGTMNVVFRRPAPDAEICMVSGTSCGALASYGKVVLQSSKGVQRTITIWNTGQISGQ